MTLRLARFLFAAFAVHTLSAQVIAIRAGHLIDPDTGTAAANQVILVDAGKFTSIGANVTIPQGAEVIDLSQYYVSPGLGMRITTWRSPISAIPRTTVTT